MDKKDYAAIANKHIGKPWASGARGPDEFDCWGLLVCVLKEDLGLDIDVDYHIHGKDTLNVTKAYEKAILSGSWRRRTTPKDGDAVALSKGKRIHHAGVWLANGCLHAVDGACVIHNSFFHLRRIGYVRIEFYRWHK